MLNYTFDDNNSDDYHDIGKASDLGLNVTMVVSINM